jgi:predicted O-methyltransferase YrrM
MNTEHLTNLIQDCLHGREDISQHRLTMFSLVCAMKPKKILELGVRGGNSTTSFLYACDLIGSHLTSVDIQDPHFICPDSLKSKWTFIKDDAIHFLQTNTEIYDMIFIDDWHAENHVYTELMLLKDKVKVDTLILLHDLMHSFSHPNYTTQVYPRGHEFEDLGPYGGVLKFIKENQNFEFATIPTNHGMTILRKTS